MGDPFFYSFDTSCLSGNNVARFIQLVDLHSTLVPNLLSRTSAQNRDWHTDSWANRNGYRFDGTARSP